MNDRIAPLLPLPVFVGQTEMASYREQVIPNYCNNPLIEALPPILTMDEAVKLLGYYPEYNEQHRTLPLELRLHLIQNVVQFFEPFPVHLDLEQRFSRMIRMGYQARNPVQQGYWQDVRHGVQSLQPNGKAQRWSRSTAVGFTIIGISGVGKSTAIEAILSLYPQVIYHSKYRDQDFNWVQIVWLKLDCPFDGSIKGLCVNFFQALDNLLGTNYYKNYTQKGKATTDEMIPHIARVSSIHSIGVLVIDEIQNLSEAKSGGSRKMLNFFVQLVNTIGMPVVPVGTYKALPLVRDEFRQARRGSGQGDLVWDRMVEDGVWQLFIESLWRYQYTQKPTELTPGLSHTLYDVSQGITDLAVKAYLLAQIRAVTSGKEVVTENIIRSVAADSFRLVNPVLAALRKGDKRTLLSFQDVQPIDLAPHIQDALQDVQTADRLSTLCQAGEHQQAASLAKEPIQSMEGNPGQDGKDSACHQSVVQSNGQLQKVVSQGARRKIAAYEALQQADFIKPVTEFLEVRGVQ